MQTEQQTQIVHTYDLVEGDPSTHMVWECKANGDDTPKVIGYSIDDAMDGSPCMYGTWVIQSDGSLKLLEYGPTPGLNWPCSEKLDPIGDTQ